MFKYDSCNNVSLKYASIYLHQFLFTKLQLKGTFQSNEFDGTLQIVDNAFKIKQDSLAWHSESFFHL